MKAVAAATRRATSEVRASDGGSSGHISPSMPDWYGAQELGPNMGRGNRRGKSVTRSVDELSNV